MLGATLSMALRNHTLFEIWLRSWSHFQKTKDGAYNYSMPRSSASEGCPLQRGLLFVISRNTKRLCYFLDSCTSLIRKSHLSNVPQWYIRGPTPGTFWEILQAVPLYRMHPSTVIMLVQCICLLRKLHIMCAYMVYTLRKDIMPQRLS